MSIMTGWERWFVYDRCQFSNRPKLEDAVMEYAKDAFLYCTVYDKDMQDMLSNIKAKHDELRKLNKRWASVDIYLTEVYKGHISLVIGESSLRLRSIRNEIECIDPDFPSKPL